MKFWAKIIEIWLYKKVFCVCLAQTRFPFIFKWKISFVYVWYKYNFLYFLIQITFVCKIYKCNIPWGFIYNEHILNRNLTKLGEIWSKLLKFWVKIIEIWLYLSFLSVFIWEISNIEHAETCILCVSYICLQQQTYIAVFVYVWYKRGFLLFLNERFLLFMFGTNTISFIF